MSLYKHLGGSLWWGQGTPHKGDSHWLQVAAVPFHWEVFSKTPQGRSPLYSNFIGEPMALQMVSYPGTAASPNMCASTPQAGEIRFRDMNL